jgi:heme exporter protein A
MPSHDDTPLVEARGLQRSFGRIRILHEINLALGSGEALAIIGPNGAGKTTLLRLLAGLMRPTRGEVRVLNQPLGRGTHHQRRAVGFLSHQTLLYDDLTLLENLTLTAKL